jgi:hypothetical protein
MITYREKRDKSLDSSDRDRGISWKTGQIYTIIPFSPCLMDMET